MSEQITKQCGDAKIILTYDGYKWYGHIPGSDDGYGNEIDAYQPNATGAAAILEDEILDITGRLRGSK